MPFAMLAATTIAGTSVVAVAQRRKYPGCSMNQSTASHSLKCEGERWASIDKRRIERYGDLHQF